MKVMSALLQRQKSTASSFLFKTWGFGEVVSVGMPVDPRHLLVWCRWEMRVTVSSP